MSVAVISLVVWLVLIFLSVTSGIEKNWLNKLTSLHAPLRIAPTDEYYRSYFYQIDSVAAASNYTLKTIGEKAQSLYSDPYAEEVDAEVPIYWPQRESGADGAFLDPVKKVVSILEQLRAEDPSLNFQDYEIGGALLKLDLHREGRISHLSQMTYLLSLADQNPRLSELMIPSDGEEFAARVIDGKIVLPSGPDTPILLPKSFRDSRVVIGDRGVLSYAAPGAATSQEQRIPICVAGFYDPGFGSLGNRCAIVPNSVTRSIYAASQTFSPDGTPTNGFFIWPKSSADAHAVKDKILYQLNQQGVAKYWRVDTFEDFEFSKDLLNQFRSDKILFTLVGGIILVVAISNIISLLILLVNDKKKEIAILQSMGATFKSIAAIFAVCGVSMGLLASLLGSLLASITLRHLDSLVALLSAMQGHAAFNPAFFGQRLPNEFSSDALLFVLIATPILSLFAGLIPAVKASRIRPSSVLRSE